jgi:hypothetical protein
MTTGLTINQGAADDQILAFKSSDVAHGITGYAETDTFALMRKSEATSGGLTIHGYKDADGTAAFALFLSAYLAEQPDTSDATSSNGCMQFDVRRINGTALAAIQDSSNGYVFSNNGIARLLIKGNGDIHATNISDGAGDMDAVALDNEDDIGLVRTFNRHTHNDIGTVMSKWDDTIKANEDDLRRVGVLTGDFYSMQRMNSLLGGAIWQSHTRQEELKERVYELESRLLALEGAK